MPLIGMTSWDLAVDTDIADGEWHQQLSGTYSRSVLAAGGTPVILPPAPGMAAAVMARIDGLILTGGVDVDPIRYGEENTASTGIDMARDSWEIELIGEARRTMTPTLGVCRGCQILAVESGGSLAQHVWGTDAHPDLWNADRTRRAIGRHTVALTGRLAALYGTDTRSVISLHHQAVASVGAGFEIVATAPDGTIEGLAGTGAWPVLAVQWHPERAPVEEESRLFEWLVREASRSVA